MKKKKTRFAVFYEGERFPHIVYDTRKEAENFIAYHCWTGKFFIKEV